jgi:hypothetical protein
MSVPPLPLLIVALTLVIVGGVLRSLVLVAIGIAIVLAALLVGIK